MSAPKFTPGEWEFRTLENGWGVFVAGTDEAICGEESDWDPIWSQRPTDGDARLIAAAPALYDALRVCAEQLAHCLGPDTEAGRAARAALAKADGRTA